MRRSLPFLVLPLILATGCGTVFSGCWIEPAKPASRSYILTGQVLAVDPDRQELTVKHDDIRGFMPGMTMPFKVRDSKALHERRPGDLITASLVVESSTGYLEAITKIGEAELPAEATTLPARTMLEPGAELPDAAFTDQAGQPRRLSDWRGRTLALTFIYTRCPVPDFCPLMDRHFSAVQQVLRDDPALAQRAHLVSVSFDPDFDTPEVLREHARRVGADPALWSYVTGPREHVDRLAGALGVTIIRDDEPLQEIVHNLRTAVVDREGRLITVFNGNDWKPAQVIAAIRDADAR